MVEHEEMQMALMVKNRERAAHGSFWRNKFSGKIIHVLFHSIDGRERGDLEPLITFAPINMTDRFSRTIATVEFFDLFQPM